jgi:hypothetical protein
MKQEEIKSPVEIVQKLLAVHSTRKEACERMAKNTAATDLQEKLKSAAAQSERFIKELLNELSQFGDAVQSEVNREDEYHEAWSEATGQTDTMNASLLAETYKKLENSLINIYTNIIDTYQELPFTLNDLLVNQAKEVKQTL